MYKLALSVLLLVRLTQAQIRNGDEICVMSESNACDVVNLTPSALDRSTVIFPGGDTRCAFNDFVDSKVKYTTNSTYFFQVFPAPENNKSKLMLYFQGGGGCFDDLTCAFGLQCLKATFNPNARPLSTGVLNRSNSENLFNGYNIVHLPYCTGDLHIGNHVKTIGDNLVYALIKPECLGHNMTLHQVGYINTKAVLDWAVKNYPNPQEIIISGSSAGSLAAQALSALVADIWQVKKNNIRYSVLADSYVGVLPSKSSAGKLISYYGSCTLDFKVSANLWDLCETNELSVVKLISFMIENVPTAEWLFLNSMYDLTQRYFYEIVDKGIEGLPIIFSGEDFYSHMADITDAYKNFSKHVSTFYVSGSQHVFLTVNDYYHNATRTPGGMLLGDFLKKWLVTNSTLDDDGKKPSAAASLSSTLLLTVGTAIIVSVLF